MLLSLSCVLASFMIFGRFYIPSFFTRHNPSGGLKIMTYNARGFNQNKKLPISDADSLIMEFVLDEQPDILCFQEAYHILKRETVLDKDYPYKYVDFVFDGIKRKRVIQALFSKYPIKNVQIIEFPQSSNAALSADILYQDVVIRVLSMHLQSFSIQPNLQTATDEKSSVLFRRIIRSVGKQEHQVNLLKKVLDTTTFPTILAGDMNNTQFSKVYRMASNGFQDTFKKKGSGFGRTFELFGMPLRIDYILADNRFEVLSHTNFDIELSDHYPIMARVKLTGEGVE